MGLRAIFAADKAYREKQAALAKKRREAMQTRRMTRKMEIADAEGAYGTFDRYVMGRTGAELHSRITKGQPISRKEYEAIPDDLKFRYLMKRDPRGYRLDDPDFIEYFEMLSPERQEKFLIRSEKNAVRDEFKRMELQELRESMGLFDILRGRTPEQLLKVRRKAEAQERREDGKDGFFVSERTIAEAEARRSIPWWRTGADADAIVRETVKEEKKLYRQANPRRRRRTSFNDDSHFMED